MKILRKHFREFHYVEMPVSILVSTILLMECYSNCFCWSTCIFMWIIIIIVKIAMLYIHNVDSMQFL